jgi:hypothetical protein
MRYSSLVLLTLFSTVVFLGSVFSLRPYEGDLALYFRHPDEETTRAWPQLLRRQREEVIRALEMDVGMAARHAERVAENDLSVATAKEILSSHESLRIQGLQTIFSLVYPFATEPMNLYYEYSGPQPTTRGQELVFDDLSPFDQNQILAQTELGQGRVSRREAHLRAAQIVTRDIATAMLSSNGHLQEQGRAFFEHALLSTPLRPEGRGRGLRETTSNRELARGRLRDRK